MGELESISMYEACLLHSKADRALRVTVSHQLEEYGLSMMEWLLLATICRGNKDGVTMSEAASALSVTLPQVTALMNGLVKKKLIKQKVSSQDRRSRRLTCTAQGKRTAEDIDMKLEGNKAELLSHIAEEDMQAYLRVVKRLSQQDEEQ